MFSAIVTFISTVLVGFLVGGYSDSPFLGAVVAIALACAVIVYKLSRLYKALVPESEPVFSDNTEEDDNEIIEEIPEEESYGVNDLDDSNEE